MTSKSDKLLEFVVLAGFLALCFALMQWVVPEKNAQHFGQALGAFTVIATLVAKSLWERGSATAIADEKKTDNTAKAFEAITATANATGAAAPDIILQPGETAQAEGQPNA